MQHTGVLCSINFYWERHGPHCFILPPPGTKPTVCPHTDISADSWGRKSQHQDSSIQYGNLASLLLFWVSCYRAGAFWILFLIGLNI